MESKEGNRVETRLFGEKDMSEEESTALGGFTKWKKRKQRIQAVSSDFFYS